MKISISNLAWDREEDEAVAAILNRLDVQNIDIAPGKYFNDFLRTPIDEIRKIRNWWKQRGVRIYGLQSLLNGSVGLNVFGTKEIQDKMQERLVTAIQIGAELGATRAVFGSPKNRDRTGLNDKDAAEMAVAFFGSVGQIATSEGVVVCLEPNPTQYGANFMTNSLETANIVRAVGLASIRMQFDTGAMIINDEDPEQVVRDFGALFGHIHASEPDLVPLGDSEKVHTGFANAFNISFPDSVATVEMVATKSEPHHSSIERALQFAKATYGSEG